LKLSTKGQYAVMAMADLARNNTGHPVTLNEIALRQDLPLQYLEQLFLKLRRQGLIKSTRGQTGGYVLAQPAKDIKISSIIAAVEEPIQVTRCNPHSNYSCQGRREQCLTHNLWEGLALHILAYLNQFSLEDLSNQHINPVRSQCKTQTSKGSVFQTTSGGLL
jgi:Rrf2 family iron-sulfur cluster assembly transcriptional regulator